MRMFKGPTDRLVEEGTEVPAGKQYHVRLIYLRSRF